MVVFPPNLCVNFESVSPARIALMFVAAFVQLLSVFKPFCPCVIFEVEKDVSLPAPLLPGLVMLPMDAPDAFESSGDDDDISIPAPVVDDARLLVVQDASAPGPGTSR